MIKIIYAMECEAAPLKKYFGDTLEYYKCGIKAKDLGFLNKIDNCDYLLNIGICGGKNIGNIYLINKIYGNKTYFPDILIENKLEQKAIKTIDILADKNLISNNSELLYDQEASIIYEHASKILAPHQISFLKIVSDSGLSKKQLSKNDISKIIERKISYIKDYINSLNSYIIKKDDLIEIKTSKYSKLLKCSVTMEARLRQQLKYAKICNINSDEFFKQLKINKVSKKDSLKILNDFDNFLITK